MRDPADRRPYTVEQLAETWQCSRESIYALIRRFVQNQPGGLPAFTIGGKLWRIKAEVVEQWQDVGGSTRSADIDSALSLTNEPANTKPSSAGETTPTSRIVSDSESMVRARVERRLMRGSAASRL